MSRHLKTNSRFFNFMKYIDTNSSTLFKIYYYWLLIFGGVFSKYHLKHCVHLNVYSIFLIFKFSNAPCGRMVSVRSLWFVIPGSSSVGRNFIFPKISWLKGHWKVDFMVTELWLKCDWNPPFPSPCSRHSAIIQSPFSRLKGKISSCVDNKN